MPARKTICPTPRDKERLSRIWVRGCHTSLVKQASNKKTDKQTKKKGKTQSKIETKTKRSNIWQGILLILYCTTLDILPAFAHKFNWSLWHFIHLNSLLLNFFNNLFNFIDIFLKNLSVLSSKSLKVMQRLGSLSVWFTHASSYLRNGNDIDSDDDTVIITIITTMIMMTMTIMVQSCLLLFEWTQSFFKLRNWCNALFILSNHCAFHIN